MVGRQRLTEMYTDWQGCQFRLEMAKNTLKGAEAAAIAAENRFKGALEMLAGANANYTYDPEKGITITGGTDLPVEPPPPPVIPPNGHGPEEMEIRRTDAQGNVRIGKLPTSPGKRKRVLRQLAKQVDRT